MGFISIFEISKSFYGSDMRQEGTDVSPWFSFLCSWLARVCTGVICAGKVQTCHYRPASYDHVQQEFVG